MTQQRSSVPHPDGGSDRGEGTLRMMSLLLQMSQGRNARAL